MPSFRSTTLLGTVCTGFLAALLTMFHPGDLAKGQERGGSMIGKPAPEFHVQGIFNENYSLEKFKGHILVMQFGASW